MLLSGARALLFPIEWEEPFGNVMVEAMACGTPVIALKRGSVSEMIKHGENGFICDSVDEMVAATFLVNNKIRFLARNYAEVHFSQETMISSYERLAFQMQHVHRS
ncbi:glycosyltransferase [Methylocystis sp. ATCC 49242]|uniref:glycosyltransferase n=1 Tax=Methylocystis sp. ATCC 49242 TaxID=622637 RepID=UPI001FCB11AC